MLSEAIPMSQRRNTLTLLIAAAALVATGCQAPTSTATSGTEAAAPAGPPAFRPAEPAPTPTPTPIPAAAAEEAPNHKVEARFERDADGALRLIATVTPEAGYHVNTEPNFPWRLAIASDAPIAAGVMQGRADAVAIDENRAEFAVRAPDPGTAAEVNGTLRLGVCNDEGCVNVNAPVVWSVTAL